MAKGKIYFWMVPGVVVIGGKEYGAEMPLPVDKIDKKQLNKWIKSGKIGEIIAVVEAECADCNGLKKEIETLEGKVEELTAESGECDDCKLLKIQAEEDKSEIERLTGEATDLQSDIKEKTALIKQLEVDLKKAVEGGKK